MAIPNKVLFLSGMIMSAALARDAGAAQANTSQPRIDPQAVSALDRMGAFLRSQRTMTVNAEMTTDEVLDSGQKVQRNGIATLKVQPARPPARGRDAPTGATSSSSMTARPSQSINRRSGTTGRSTRRPRWPSWSTKPSSITASTCPSRTCSPGAPNRARRPNLKGAINLGPSMVRGVKCDHYAFHQADVDWEVWIQQGPQPLPRKLVITTTTEKTQPQHVAVLTWDLAPRLDESLFTFMPPATAQRIDFDVAREQLGGAAPGPRGRSRPEPEPITRKVNHEHAQSQSRKSLQSWAPGWRSSPSASSRNRSRAPSSSRARRWPIARVRWRARLSPPRRSSRPRSPSGTVVHSLPPSCSSVMVGNVAYQQCGNTWYQPRYCGLGGHVRRGEPTALSPRTPAANRAAGHSARLTCNVRNLGPARDRGQRHGSQRGAARRMLVVDAVAQLDDQRRRGDVQGDLRFAGEESIVGEVGARVRPAAADGGVQPAPAGSARRPAPRRRPTGTPTRPRARCGASKPRCMRRPARPAARSRRRPRPRGWSFRSRSA